MAAHPTVVGLDMRVEQGELEHCLPSGDRLDVLFRDRDDWIAVEVKSAQSEAGDITRGLFQCVKYQAVIEAYQAVQRLEQNARVVLVLEGALPGELMAMKSLLGVEVVEFVVMP